MKTNNDKLWKVRKRYRCIVTAYVVMACAGLALLAGLLAFHPAPAAALFGAGLAVTLWIAVGLGIRQSSRTRESELYLDNLLAQEQVRAMETELEKKRQELQALQNQINPHFLYNTLDTFRGAALESGNRTLADMLGALSAMFKYSVNYDVETVTVNMELGYLNRYVKIQQMRFPGRFEYQEQVLCSQSRLVMQDCPRFVLQPLVENAIRHGMRDIRRGGQITVTLETVENHFLITVDDNGCGIPAEQAAQLNARFAKGELAAENKRSDGGVGLYNVNRRIKMFCGEEYGLTVSSRPGAGTRFVVHLPLSGGIQTE